MVLYLAGLGLGSLDYITLKLIKEVKKCDILYLDTYTGFISNELMDWLVKIFRARLRLATRKDLEDDLLKIVEEARNKDVAVLVSGDPLIATTHIPMLIEAIKRGVPYRIIHGISIYSAAASIAGLQAYKFGRTATLAKKGDPKETYRVIRENLERGLHTLVLLDTAEGGLTIHNALRRLLEVEDSFSQGVVREDTLVIGLAMIGFEGQTVRVGLVEELIREEFPPPPHTLVFPGELHFMEVEALTKMYKIKEEAVRKHKPPRCEKERAWRYIVKTGEVIEALRAREANREAQKMLEIAMSYLEDAQRFWSSGEIFNALALTAYSWYALGYSRCGPHPGSWKF